MRKQRIFLSTMIMLCMIITLFSGCGPKAQDNSSSDSTPNTDTSVELNCYLFDYPNNPTFSNAIEKFKQENANIKINIHETGDYDTKIGILIAGGEEIDAIAVRNPIQKLEWARANTIIPMDELGQKNNFDFKKEFGIKAEEVMVDGKPYAMPVFASTWFMLYNKSMFDAAEIPYPSATKAMTWSEYADLAKKLTTGEGADKKYGAFHMVWPMYWYTQGSSILGGGNKFYTSDGKSSNIEDPAWAKSLKLAYDMQHTDKSVMTYTDVKVQKLRVPSFNTGKFGMFYTGDFALNLCLSEKRDFKIGIAPLPIPDSKDEDYTYTFGGYGSLAIPKTSKHPEETFKFMLDVSKNVGELADTMIPSVVTEETKNRICDKLAKIYEADGIKAEDFASVLFGSKDWIFEKISGPGAAKYEAIAKEEVEKYFTDIQDLDTTIKNIKERADKVIKEANSK